MKNETSNEPNSSGKILSMNSEITMQVGNHSFIRHAVIWLKFPYKSKILQQNMHFHDDDDEGCEEKGKYCFIVALRIPFMTLVLKILRSSWY